jgi:patatin-related protein
VAGKAKELRLGLVCYGGSSLAIYMHGITKEINRLLSASAARADARKATLPSEALYADLLDALANSGPDGTDLRVIVDVIAGTSAGGINGIFLGKAIARNRTQDALRDVWFDRGDMSQLFIGPRKIAGVTIPWKAKIPFLLRHALKRSPLRGDDMSRWLHEALNKMDAAEPTGSASLLPPGHPLDLYVTITDFYGYQRLIPLSRPRYAADARHRHALNFHFESGNRDDFTDNAGLAFAARTTSCFPAVFPPVNPASFAETIGASIEPTLQRCFRSYHLGGADPNKTYFIDGGVLDNKPFGWAIDAIIHRRPAEGEVDRRLLYIEPDPGGRTARQGGDDPQTLAAAMGALAGIPRSEPILDDLLTVAEHNDRVSRIRDIIEANFDRVAGIVDGLVPDAVLAGEPPDRWPWADWSRAVNTLALDNAGMSYSTYLRLKVSSVLDGFANSICTVCNYPEDSNHAALVRDTIHSWGRTAGLYSGVERTIDADPCAERRAADAPLTAFQPSEDQIGFLQAFDVGYMRRRLRFVISAFNWWYGCTGTPNFPNREDLDRGKAILYENIATLDALVQLRQTPRETSSDEATQLRRLVLTTFPEAGLQQHIDRDGIDGHAYAASRAAELDTLFEHAQTFLHANLRDFAPSLLSQLTPVTADWHPNRRRDIVVRYLGFPIWDVLLYPIQALGQIGEGDHIDVVRVSPHEATLLPAPAAGKVEGTRVHHFYAFFSREARENDYLWGRLDAAEQLIRLLLETSNSGEPLEAWCKRAFISVLEEEQTSLTTIRQKTAGLRAAIEAL